jgi:NAD(P)-dependent dehydrogenase (short-subunit alcohol dehydrogenase family)
MIDLSGKRALVMGGTSGIGKGIALAFARAGAQVAAASRDLDRVTATAAELRALGAEPLTITCDARDLESVRRLMSEVERMWRRLDIVVNAQGTTRKTPSERVPDEEFAGIVDLNLHSVFRVCREAYPLLKRAGGSIINLASLGASIGLPDAAAYSASKGGVVQMTKVLAVDWAQENIRCNAIAPGWIMTPLSAPILEQEQYRTPILRRIPLQRFGIVDDVAGAALFLASDLARYVTGTVLTVDGGVLASV